VLGNPGACPESRAVTRGPMVINPAAPAMAVAASTVRLNVRVIYLPFFD